MISAVLLCGGKSRRMGHPKTELPFGESTLLDHMVTLLRPLFEHLVIVAGPEQVIPDFREAVVVRDLTGGRGPLGGMQSGFRATRDYGDWTFVAACDLPFLTSRVVELFPIENNQVRETDIVCPHDSERAHPLCASYRTDVVETVDTMLEEGNLRVRHLLCRHPTLYVDATDPALRACMENVNTPEAYARAKDRLVRKP